MPSRRWYRSLALPEVQADSPVALGRRQRPPELAQVVAEGEGTGEVLRADVDEARRLLERHVARAADQGGELGLRLGRERDAGGAPFLCGAVAQQEMIADVVADDRAAYGLRRPRGPPADHGHAPAGVGEDVPDRLHSAHLAGHGQLLAGLLVHRHKVPDAVLLRWPARRDGRPEDRAEHRLAAEQAPVGALLPEPGEVRHL